MGLLSRLRNGTSRMLDFLLTMIRALWIPATAYGGTKGSTPSPTLSQNGVEVDAPGSGGIAVARKNLTADPAAQELPLPIATNWTTSAGLRDVLDGMKNSTPSLTFSQDGIDFGTPESGDIGGARKDPTCHSAVQGLYPLRTTNRTISVGLRDELGGIKGSTPSLTLSQNGTDVDTPESGDIGVACGGMTSRCAVQGCYVRAMTNWTPWMGLPDILSDMKRSTHSQTSCENGVNVGTSESRDVGLKNVARGDVVSRRPVQEFCPAMTTNWNAGIPFPDVPGGMKSSAPSLTFSQNGVDVGTSQSGDVSLKNVAHGDVVSRLPAQEFYTTTTTNWNDSISFPNVPGGMTSSTPSLTFSQNGVDVGTSESGDVGLKNVARGDVVSRLLVQGFYPATTTNWNVGISFPNVPGGMKSSARSLTFSQNGVDVGTSESGDVGLKNLARGDVVSRRPAQEFYPATTTNWNAGISFPDLPGGVKSSAASLTFSQNGIDVETTPNDLDMANFKEEHLPLFQPAGTAPIGCPVRMVSNSAAGCGNVSGRIVSNGAIPDAIAFPTHNEGFVPYDIMAPHFFHIPFQIPPFPEKPKWNSWEKWDFEYKHGIPSEQLEESTWFTEGFPFSERCFADETEDLEVIEVYDAGNRPSSVESSSCPAERSSTREAKSRTSLYRGPPTASYGDAQLLLRYTGFDPPDIAYPVHLSMEGVYAQPFDVPSPKEYCEALPELFAAPVHVGRVRQFGDAYDSDDPGDDTEVQEVYVPTGYTVFELNDDIKTAPKEFRRKAYEFVRTSL